jgi:glycosyltransferase involved in cell wall biosynthesis
MVDVFKNHNISYMITLHDFYSVCPLINKLYKNEEYCGLNPSIEKCSECLKTTLKVNIDITSWRKEWKRLLDNAYKVITPSNSTKEEIQEIYNELSISVIEHGIDIKKETSTLRLGSKNDIAFIGAIGVHKGGKILDELIKINKNKNCTIHLFGIKTKQYSNVSKNFIDHGRYTRNELKELLKKYNIKLICLFSIWPETYSYTLTEAIACGIPVVSFDLGAIAERVSKYNLGWTLEHTLNSKEILKKINGILSNERAYNEVIKSINQYEIISSEKMSNEYNSIYSKKATLIAKLPGSIRDKIVNNRVFLVESYNNDYSWVFNTLKWKIISFFKIPKPIKKVYRKIKQQKGDLDENKKK